MAIVALKWKHPHLIWPHGKPMSLVTWDRSCCGTQGKKKNNKIGGVQKNSNNWPEHHKTWPTAHYLPRSKYQPEKRACREQTPRGINCCDGLGATDKTLLFLLIHLLSFTVFIITMVLVFLFINESKMTKPLDAFVCETLLSAGFVSPLPSQL